MTAPQWENPSNDGPKAEFMIQLTEIGVHTGTFNRDQGENPLDDGPQSWRRIASQNSSHKTNTNEHTKQMPIIQNKCEQSNMKQMVGSLGRC